MIMNTRDKEITDQPRLNHFDLKSNSTCNIYITKEHAGIKLMLFVFFFIDGGQILPQVAPQ